MSLRQTQNQVQKQILAPVMQQSIEILMLPALELEQAIEQELEANPLLEKEQESLQDDNPASNEDDSFETVADQIRSVLEAPRVTHTNYEPDDDQPDARPIPKGRSLEEALLTQLHVEFNDPLRRLIGELIIGNLNEDGFLDATVEEIAKVAETDDLSLVESVLIVVQSYEPLGVAARDLRECLLIQAKALFNGHARIIMKIIQDHLDDLGNKRYQVIARALDISVAAVQQSAELIGELEPRPARNERPINPHFYVKPDVIIRADIDRDDPNKHFEADLNRTGTTALRVSPQYRRMLERTDLNAEERAFLKEKLNNALTFMKSIGQRGQTLKQIAEFILQRQRDFFLEGPSGLQPMSLRDVAGALGRNESTICRAVQNKYLDTPQGLYPFKYFFSQAVGNDGYKNFGVASRSIKEEIQNIVDSEDKTRPLSDMDIQAVLARSDIKVARRTISKYRKQLNILPSHLRKK